MSDQQFAVVFKGKVVEGADPAQVRANLAKLFKADAKRIEAMFSGKTVVVKKGVDEDTAQHYIALLSKAGAVAAIVDTTAKTQAVSKPAAEPVKPEQSEPATPQAAVPTQAPAAAADETSSTPPQAIDATMAEPGVILVDPQHVEAAIIDTAHLDMAEVGADLVEYQHVDEPEFDLSAFTLDPPGVILVEPEKITPPDFDTSELSLDEN
ncbi:MAG: hypothetical protein O7B81_05080 [Gammaproteobacteria bacterium]|nr:hypothetical protein [Gammaproteobacteria bacterium]